jgi:hypothetical protein
LVIAFAVDKKSQIIASIIFGQSYGAPEKTQPENQDTSIPESLSIQKTTVL